MQEEPDTDTLSASAFTMQPIAFLISLQRGGYIATQRRPIRQLKHSGYKLAVLGRLLWKCKRFTLFKM